MIVRNENCKVGISEDFELDLYTRAFSESSNRVRYVMITITIASIVILVGLINSRPESWTNSRLLRARGALLALQAAGTEAGAESTLDRPAKADAPENDEASLYTPEILARGSKWAEFEGLRDEKSLRQTVGSLETSQIGNALNVRMPILGLGFDVNDLGLFSAIGFFAFMIMLTFCISRYHENLYLAMWKIRRLFEADGREESGESRANLLYHSLAMTQVFNKPPTLARWSRRVGSNLTQLVIFLPLSVQLLIFTHDYRTSEFGRLLSKYSTDLSLAIQFGCLLAVIPLTGMCFSYARSNSGRWRRAFENINPSLADVEQPSWLEWVGWRGPKEDYQESINEARRKRAERAQQETVEQQKARNGQSRDDEVPKENNIV